MVDCTCLGWCVRLRPLLQCFRNLILAVKIHQVSDGGVHSHINHLFALLETAKQVGVPHVYIHFFGDGQAPVFVLIFSHKLTKRLFDVGRDTAPRSAAGYAKQLMEFTEKENVGEIGKIAHAQICCRPFPVAH